MRWNNKRYKKYRIITTVNQRGEINMSKTKIVMIIAIFILVLPIQVFAYNDQYNQYNNYGPQYYDQSTNNTFNNMLDFNQTENDNYSATPTPKPNSKKKQDTDSTDYIPQQTLESLGYQVDYGYENSIKVSGYEKDTYLSQKDIVVLNETIFVSMKKLPEILKNNSNTYKIDSMGGTFYKVQLSVNDSGVPVEMQVKEEDRSTAIIYTDKDEQTTFIEVTVKAIRIPNGLKIG